MESAAPILGQGIRAAPDEVDSNQSDSEGVDIEYIECCLNWNANVTDQAPESYDFCSFFSDKAGFSGKLTEDERHALGASSQTMTVKRGETHQTSDLMSWPIVAVSNGVLSLQELLNDGRRTIAALFMRGEILDMRGSLDRNLGSLVALDTVNICQLCPTVFDRILDTNPAARTLAWEGLASQTHRAIRHASDLAKKQALEKLASFIFECRHRSGNPPLTDHVKIPIRRRDLAEYLGMQPETISRCFKKLEENGIISVSDMSVLKLQCVPTLRRIANGDREAQRTDKYRGRAYKISAAGA